MDFNRLWVVAGVCGLLGVTACGGESSPGSEPATLESFGASEEAAADDADPDATDDEPVAASSEGPAENWPEPEVPDEISEETDEGAEAFIQYWFDVRHYSRLTGDTAPLEDISHPECELCNIEVEKIEAVYPEGWIEEDSPTLIDGVEPFEFDGVAHAYEYLTDEPAFTVHWGDGSKDSADGYSDVVFDAYLLFEDDGWIFGEFGHDPDNLADTSLETDDGE